MGPCRRQRRGSSEEVPRCPPRSPSTFRSSSAIGQWMASPSPRISHVSRAFGSAWASLGNQTSGTVMLRPSARSTVSVSSVVRTCRANARVLTVEVGMLDGVGVRRDERRDGAQFTRAVPRRSGQRDRCQPVLCEASIVLHVDVRQFSAFFAEGEEPLRAVAKNCGRHAWRAARVSPACARAGDSDSTLYGRPRHKAGCSVVRPRGFEPLAF